MDIPFNVIFLAGGKGIRMGKELPKQYLLIHQKPLALYSFEILASLPEIQDFVVVCEPQYEEIFYHSGKQKGISLKFAKPGPRRQDSVFNGIQCLENDSLVCIHDSVRPFIDSYLIRKLVKAAETWGAAALGVRVRSTIKVCDEEDFVINTPDRSLLWEIQTPQVVLLNLLREGFAYAHKKQVTITDDVSLVELLGRFVKIEEGSYANIKVTTPEDLAYLEKLIENAVL